MEAQVTGHSSGVGAVVRRSGPALTAVAAIAGVALAVRGAGTWLVVEEPLVSAPAIVVLGGGTPSREQAAAEVFRSGWAPRVVLVPGAPPDLEARRAALERSGVPVSAVLIASRSATNTFSELAAAAELIQPDHAPVILVTSPYHARRVQLIWRYVTGGRSQPIVRVTRDELFDSSRWWVSRRSIDEVTHEYLGLVDALLGFRLST